MGFEAASRPPPSSCLCVRSPLSTGLTPSHLSMTPFSSFSFSCKSTALCCSGGSTKCSSSPSARSYSRRWYNPLRRRPPGDRPSLEIVRRWIEADQPPASQDKNASKHRDLYTDIPSLYLKWERRKHVICEELIGWNPDIICLQEVDRYFELSKILEKAGYVGSYKRRTGDAVDGCAIFWKANEFWLLEEESIKFKELGLRDNVAQLSVFQACKEKSKKLLVGNIHVLYNPSRGDVKLGQIRHLSSRAHILSEKWGGIPVLLAGDFNTTPQSAIYKFLSTSKLDIMSYDRRELSGQRSCHPAQVFGEKQDLSNSLFLIDRLFTCGWTDEEIKTAGGNAEGEVVVHPLNLKSSYATIRGSARTRDSNGEPIATSYHSKFFGTVDYIWFNFTKLQDIKSLRGLICRRGPFHNGCGTIGYVKSVLVHVFLIDLNNVQLKATRYSDGLVPARVLDTPPVDILRGTGGLPCKTVGSDHLALVSEFAFAQDIDVGEGTVVATSKM